MNIAARNTMISTLWLESPSSGLSPSNEILATVLFAKSIVTEYLPQQPRFVVLVLVPLDFSQILARQISAWTHNLEPNRICKLSFVLRICALYKLAPISCVYLKLCHCRIKLLITIRHSNGLAEYFNKWISASFKCSTSILRQNLYFKLIQS